MDALAAENVATGGENNKEDNPSAEEDEGAGQERAEVKVSASKCSGHG